MIMHYTVEENLFVIVYKLSEEKILKALKKYRDIKKLSEGMLQN